jgi:hypothetical protein
LGLYVAGYGLLSAHLDIQFHYRTGLFFLLYSGTIIFLISATALLVKVVWIMLSEQSEHPTRQLLAWCRAESLKNGRFGNGVHGILLMAATILIFSTVKTAIPSIQPFRWDEPFMRLDRAIFAGVDPWIVLNSIFGHPYFTGALAIFYNLWIVVVTVVLSVAVFSGSNRLRLQFLLSAMLTWTISGNVLAVLFSSAGPCYYGLVVGGADPYLQQMQYLRGADLVTGMVFSLRVQDMLWLAHSTNAGRISGISAMPSLHVMFALLIGFYLWRINRTVGGALLIYAAIIFVGSVHLAWHYAVDGIAALVLAMITWRVSGWLVKDTDILEA